MQPEMIRRYARPVPRYTSYPTAPHFSEAFAEGDYRAWLGQLGAEHRLSLYVHIPFCDSLCWFCGCHTKHTRKYQPVAEYLKVLRHEIETVASLAESQPRVSRLHWGGGSPTILTETDIAALAAYIKRCFRTSDRTEFSVEIDPRGLTDAQMDALAEAGLNRASIGVQDFNRHVQQRINRVQTFEETARVVNGLRCRGVRSLNLDVMYGLPGQRNRDLESTIDRALELEPDRIALFGYAHVPWMKKHQSMIRAESLPGPVERFEQSEQAALRLVEAGYHRIGFDHFARQDDSLALAARTGRLRRNFQGYTDDTSDALIGLGASAIGDLPGGYVQNTTATGEYMRQIRDTGLAVARGYRMRSEDRMRRYLIDRLMCDYEVSVPDLQQRFGDDADVAACELADFASSDPDKMLEAHGDRYCVSELGRPFVRSIAAVFDRFLASGKARHSIAV